MIFACPRSYRYYSYSAYMPGLSSFSRAWTYTLLLTLALFLPLNHYSFSIHSCVFRSQIRDRRRPYRHQLDVCKRSSNRRRCLFRVCNSHRVVAVSLRISHLTQLLLVCSPDACCQSNHAEHHYRRAQHALWHTDPDIFSRKI